jgi:Holliday junction resolvasome RuvABC endonuclease subunit
VTTVIGIDPSLSALGLAVWQSGRPLQLLTVREPAWSTACPAHVLPERCDRISRRVTGWVEATGPTLAVIEGIIKPSEEQARGMSTLDIARLRGVIECDLFRVGVPIVRIHPSTLKAYAVKGGATKAQMLAAARAVLGARYPVANDNEADAFWLFAMAAHQYGRRVVPATPQRLRSLRTVTGWPTFRME